MATGKVPFFANRLLATNAHYTFYSFDAFLERQASLGIRQLELYLMPPHVWVDHMQGGETAALLETIAKHGLSVRVVRPECASWRYMPFAADAGCARRSRAHYVRCAEISRALGADMMSLPPLGAYLDEHPNEAFARAVEQLRSICEAVAPTGVTIALESLCPYESVVANSLPALRSLVKAVDHPSLVASLDIVAMSEAGETIAQWFEAFGDRLQYVRFSDGRAGPGKYVCGTGVYPMERYLAQLDACGYEGPIALPISGELDNPAAADAENLRMLARYARGMGGTAT